VNSNVIVLESPALEAVSCGEITLSRRPWVKSGGEDRANPALAV